MNSYLYLILIWIHSMGAGIWLGGSLLYFLKSTVYKESNKTDFISEYNSVLTVSTIILFASGILISFDKLTFGNYSNFSDCYCCLMFIKNWNRFLVRKCKNCFSIFYI